MEDGDLGTNAAHIHPSMRVYRRRREMATEYDPFYRGTPLLEFDTEHLDGHAAEPGPLLDLGCGTGRHVVHFARRGFDVTGIDFSTYMIEETHGKLLEHNLRARLMVHDLFDLSPFEDNSFRYCICMFSTLGLIRGKRNRLTLLKEIRRVLTPGGLFLFHVHNRLYNVFDPAGRRWLLHTYLPGPFIGLEVGDKIMDGYRDIPDMYLHIFSDREVRSLVKRSGLRLRELFHLNATRNKALAGRRLRRWRANGFLVTAAK